MQVADALTANRISYVLTGSFASNYYGIPRSTNDADFIVQLGTALGREFALQLGGEFILDAQLSFETVTGTYRQYVRHRKSRFKIELFLLSSDEHDQERFRRRVEVDMTDRKVWLLSPEDVIISKLRWARNKDLDDVRNVMAVQQNRLDWPYIEAWCRRHDTVDLMNEIRGSVPEI